MNQVSIPVEIHPEEVARKQSLGDALQMCAELAGFSLDKELQQRGYDLHTVRKLESETEKVNRQLREENAALRRVLMGGVK